MNDISPSKLLDSLFDGVYFVDLDRRITFWNRAAERITGFTREEVLGSLCHANLLKHIDSCGNDLCNGCCPLSATLNDGQMREASIVLHHKNGYRVPVQVRSTPVRDDHGVIIGAVEVFTDSSNMMKILEDLEKLKKDAYLDPLTGLANRRYAEVSLDTARYEWQTHRVPFGVLFLDIDHFKDVNDTHGHLTGDLVLVEVGRAISGVLRKFDVAARWGGEEFLALLTGANFETLNLVAERIRTVIERNVLQVCGASLSVTVSLGGSLVAGGETVESLLHRADEMMYQSKRDGRNRVTLG